MYIYFFKGEIFGGIHVDSDSNDAEILMQSLENCCSCSSHGHIKECGSLERRRNSVPELLSTIKGPWALIYWQVTWSGKFSVVLLFNSVHECFMSGIYLLIV